MFRFKKEKYINKIKINFKKYSTNLEEPFEKCDLLYQLHMTNSIFL